jgi:hypothetical protein
MIKVRGRCFVTGEEIGFLICYVKTAERRLGGELNGMIAPGQ